MGKIKIKYKLNQLSGESFSIKFEVPIKVGNEIKVLEVYFFKYWEIKDGKETVRVMDGERFLNGNKIDKSCPLYRLPQGIYRKIKKIAKEKLLPKININLDNDNIACPYCGYKDPFLIQLKESNKIGEVDQHTCPNCGKNFYIPHGKPLYWKK